MLKYPDGPGHHGESTSIAAAESVADKAQAIRTRLYALFLDGNELTAQEASAQIGTSHLNAMKRISELRANGLAEDSGAKRINKSGMQATVWKLRTEEGTDIDYRRNTKADLLATIDRLQREVNRLREQLRIGAGQLELF
jgi:predicted ArsR family transcriptional regulator